MNELTRHPATLQEVADAAGVHRSTASRALNPEKAHLIGQDVVERVQAAALRMGYRRDVLAAGLRTKRSRLIGVVVPDMANLVFAPILSATEIVLAENGYSVLIANAGGCVEHQIRIVDQLIAHRVEGIVLATAQQEDPVLTRCLEAGVPAVLVNRAETTARASTVISDDTGGMRLAVEHLTALGHRKIGHIAGPRHLSTGSLRRRGFEQAMAEAGPIWSGIAERHGLAEADLTRLASWWHTDADLGRPMEAVTDMTKSRKAGFLDYQGTPDSFFDLFARLKEDRIIPG